MCKYFFIYIIKTVVGSLILFRLIKFRDNCTKCIIFSKFFTNINSTKYFSNVLEILNVSKFKCCSLFKIVEQFHNIIIEFKQRPHFAIDFAETS